jgi:CheY-like chemotaxis protein
MIGYGKHILLAYDPEQMPLPLATILAPKGYIVVRAHDGVQAISEMRFRHFDAVVPDAFLPDIAHLHRVTQSQLPRSDIPIILFSNADGNTYDLVEVRVVFAWIRQFSDSGILLGMLALAMERRVERESVWAPEMVGV